MEELVVTSPKEKRQSFLYVLILFSVSAIILICVIISRNSSYLSGLSKESSGFSGNTPAIVAQQKKIAASFDSVLANIDRSRQDPDQYPFSNETIIHDMQSIHNAELDARESDSSGIPYRCYVQMERFLVLYKEESDRQKNLNDNLKLYQGKQ